MNSVAKRSALYLTALSGLLFGSGLFTSCEKDILEGQPSWLGNSIYERLKEGIEVNGEKKTFKYTIRLIDDLDQTEVMSHTGSRTLFAATDEAYEAWFKNNDWKVSSYEQLTLTQKKLLFNNSVITNAYLLELMSNVSTTTAGEEPKSGRCMRRATASSVYDSVPTMYVAEMPVNPLNDPEMDGWKRFREAGKPIHIMRDNTSAPMIHFLPEFMTYNNITTDDLQRISNDDNSTIADSWINGKKVISTEQTCKNGYIYVVDGVIESNRNMAEIISQEPEMSEWARQMNRFSVPIAATSTNQANYQRLYNTSDSVFVLRYYNSEANNPRYTTPTGLAVYKNAAAMTGLLKFDPAWNQYIYTNSMGYDLHYDAAAMIVPTNEALLEWWNNGGGKSLQEEYLYLDSVPYVTISKLINVNMLKSFIDAVPSKFGSVLDDSKVELGIKPTDIVKSYMGCNGVVYLVNKVFGPSEFRSVVYPALSHESSDMGVIYNAIESYEFGPYLNSMESYYSMILPKNVSENYGTDESEGDVCMNYIDPCTYGAHPVLMQFYYDRTNKELAAHRYNCTINYDGSVTVGEALSDASTTVIDDRLTDLVDNLIVVGNIEDGKKYYKTKAGSFIRVNTSASNSTGLSLAGGFQMETGVDVPVTTVYDMSSTGNGKSYTVEDFVPMTAQYTVYDILKNKAEEYGSTCTKFYELLANDASPDALLSKTLTVGTTSYYCTNYATDNTSSLNLRLFDHYNYTVYVPTDTTIQRLIDQEILPTWEDWTLAGNGDPESTTTTPTQDSIAKIIHDFIRYHIQDNAIYIGGDPVTEMKYETSKQNPVSKRYYPVTVNANASGLTVTDRYDNSYQVIQKNLYNQTSREYWISGSPTSNNRTIYSSSNAVVHEIDGALIYDKKQLTPWKHQFTIQ